MKKIISFEEVKQICVKHQIEVRNLESAVGSFDKRIFFINQELLLRVSESAMTLEQEKFRRVEGLNSVPKILHVGELETDSGPVFYTILTLLPGDDFVNTYEETTLVEQKQLGQAVADFLDDLGKIAGADYDIGLYIPIISRFSGTWRDGHQEYWEHLRQESEKLSLKPDSVQVFERAFQLLQASIAVLDFQSGPKLLHNDFHPKNIILHQGEFSGVIDWECSQFGEADFELCHLIHWCVYPPHPNIDYRPFLRALFDAAPKCTQVPNLVQRLTIYQIEHEIQQIIWRGSEVESWRVPRLTHWMSGGVENLFREIAG